MKIKFLQKEIWLQNRKYVILTPTFHTKDIYACEYDVDNYMIFGDQQSLQYLACVMLLAAENRDKIIYLSDMEKDLPNHLHRFSYNTKNKELVLLHHSLQLNINVWKELRQKLHQQNGKIRSFERNPRKFSSLHHEEYQHLQYQENNDRILIKSNFDTLFLIGSKIVFDYASGFFEPLSREGAGSFIRTYGHAHYHLDMFTRNTKGLCVDYFDKELWDTHLKDT